MACVDCPRTCVTRGAESYCGTTRPGRIHWHGVTYAEEHEIAPTYEIFFTGCSLRCRFCFVPDAIHRPDEGLWLSPEALVEVMAEATVPPFRAISFVGGDPTVNRPYIKRLIPLLRRHFPDVDLVLNTNLYLSEALCEWWGDRVDWVVGDVHFWTPECADAIADSEDYPAVSRLAAEAFMRRGDRLILRILALPGHIECCALPTLDWAAGLGDDVWVRVMKNYSPVSNNGTDPDLGRMLNGAERARLDVSDSSSGRTLATGPLPCAPPLRAESRDVEGVVEIDDGGYIRLPFVTGALLPLAADLNPELRPYLKYLERHAR